MHKKPVKATKLDIELLRAARNGNVKLVNKLLNQGARPTAQDVDGWTCLHAAAVDGHEQVVALLVSHKDILDVNITTWDGRSALYFAALEGSKSCVEILLKNGADPHIRTTENKTCLDVAKLFDRTDLLSILDEALNNPPPPRIPAAALSLIELKKKMEQPVVPESIKSLHDKAESYVAPDPSQWKKTDFSKWNKVKSEEWEALEAHRDLLPDEPKKTSSSASKPQESAPPGKYRLSICLALAVFSAKASCLRGSLYTHKLRAAKSDDASMLPLFAVNDLPYEPYPTWPSLISSPLLTRP